jgi:RNA polymerase sigma-70 factor (ECF subfamily)
MDRPGSGKLTKKLMFTFPEFSLRVWVVSGTERVNEQWIKDLTLPPPDCNAALTDLRGFLLRGLEASFRSRLDTNRLEDYVQDALETILEKLETFRGESKFTTWCMKIAVNTVLTDLRKKRWGDVSLDGLELPEKFVSEKAVKRLFEGPEAKAVKHDLVDKINGIIEHDLTEKQRTAMGMVLFHGMPLEEIAERMEMKRGALYKLLHDARKKIRDKLLDYGYDPVEILDLVRG